MKTRNILIAIAAALTLLAAGFFYYRGVHLKHPKYVVVKKHIVVVTEKTKEGQTPLLPAISKKFANPKVAIVLDDFGNNKNNLGVLFSMHQPVTLSILPDLKYSTEIARASRSRGYEVILHLPLEPHNANIKEEDDTIKSGMSEAQIYARLKKEIAGIPGLTGVSNHMGSKATEDKALMTTILKYLKAHSLYFSDSMTSQKSVCREVAREIGIPYARRDVFLDNSEEIPSIEKQMLVLRRLAFRKGRAMAIGHDKKNTVAVLARMMPEMAKEGIEFVYLSEMVK